eukprot:138724-Pleurochrysis_carterae.AAC.2
MTGGVHQVRCIPARGEEPSQQRRAKPWLMSLQAATSTLSSHSEKESASGRQLPHATSCRASTLVS